MDEARNKKTLQTIFAYELWIIEEIQNIEFICPSCSIEAIPCSYNKSINKVRPYFKFHKNINHDINCEFLVSAHYREIAKNKSISDTNGFPLSHPSSLILDENYEKIEISNQVKQNNTKKFNSQSVNEIISKRHNYSVRTLNSIAKYYIMFPYDRSNMPLKIPGIEGDNYHECIKKLPDNFNGLNPQKIYYGNVYFSKNFEITEESIKIYLSNGIWNEKIREKSYILNINVKKWKKVHIDYIVSMLSSAQEEYKDDRSTIAYLFFYGKQEQINREVIYIDNYKYFACIINRKFS